MRFLNIKCLAILAGLFLVSCAHQVTPQKMATSCKVPAASQKASTPSTHYQVGKYQVYITDLDTINEKWSSMSKPDGGPELVNGFINYKKKEIWSINSTSILIHEFKHMLEGDFHITFNKKNKNLPKYEANPNLKVNADKVK